MWRPWRSLPQANSNPSLAYQWWGEGALARSKAPASALTAVFGRFGEMPPLTVAATVPGPVLCPIDA